MMVWASSLRLRKKKVQIHTARSCTDPVTWNTLLAISTGALVGPCKALAMSQSSINQSASCAEKPQMIRLSSHRKQGSQQVNRQTLTWSGRVTSDLASRPGDAACRRISWGGSHWFLSTVHVFFLNGWFHSIWEELSFMYFLDFWKRKGQLMASCWLMAFEIGHYKWFYWSFLIRSKMADDMGWRPFLGQIQYYKMILTQWCLLMVKTLLWSTAWFMFYGCESRVSLPIGGLPHFYVLQYLGWTYYWILPIFCSEGLKPPSRYWFIHW